MKTTKIVILSITLLLIIFDIIVATDAIERNTISQIFAAYANIYPIIPIAWGTLTGHFLFNRSFASYRKRPYYNKRYIILSAIGVALVALTIFSLLPQISASIYFCIGCIIGFELWPQFKENVNKPIR